MKVITQLVQHFWSRQALSAAQAEYLVSQGFVRAADLPGFEMSIPSEKQPSSFKFKKPMPPYAHEHVADQLESRGPSKRQRAGKAGALKRGPGTKAARAAHTEKELAKLVEAVFVDRAVALEAFRRWAAPLGPADDWVQAAVHVRQARDDQILDTLAKAIRKKTVALGDLW